MKNFYLKIIFLLVVFFACAAFFAIFDFKGSNINSSQTLTETGAVEISAIPLDKIIEDEYGGLFYIDNQTKRKVVRNNNDLSRLQFSPLKNKYGFMENSDINDVAIPYDRQTLIHVGDINIRQTKEVYHGSFKTSGWEWFSNEEILVSSGCGTECQVLYLIDLATNKQYQLHYGVDYKWSPDKTKVFAFHYAVMPGITVGDKIGNELFTLRRNRQNDSKLFELLQAEWSLDSTKIALVIKKDNEEKLELLVFDVLNNFDKIFQTDIEILENIELAWDADQVIVNSSEYNVEPNKLK